jgi:cellulose synthase (UDP-forming)
MTERIAPTRFQAPRGLRLNEDLPIRAESPSAGMPGPQDVPLLVPLLSGKQRAVFAALSVCWALSLVAFWSWWLHPEHNVDSFRYVANCAVLFWTTAIPGYFVLVFARARIPNPGQAVPTGLRVAMVVTKAPSEPFAVVRTTLLAMLSQAYPHDTWLADEDPSAETIDWCARHEVQLSTRKDVAAYHNASWPRRTRCKEGNLAYFYDHYGYERYDFVAQLDADHVPADGYLEAMLRPFADPCVGYVSAPSICDSNAATSWSARGRLYVEGALHGAVQAGYNGGLAPLCFGSHYAVRTAALREIGGLGPELAEDHSTTLMMNAKGWRGVHALDAIAHGEGPHTFADMATQEFQWSKSLMVVLLRYTRQYLGPLPLRLKAQFLFIQFWYPLFSLTMAASVAMPAIALLMHRAWAHVAYTSYFLHASAVTGTILLLMAWVRRAGCFRPYDAKVASWEGIVFLFVRWPWSLLGSVSAIADCVRGREFAFRVTPKTAAPEASPPLRVVLPYLLLSLLCSLPLLAVNDAGDARGFYVLSIFNALAYFVVALLIVVAHAREQGQRTSTIKLLAGDGPLVRRGLFTAAVLVLTVGMSMRMPVGFDALLWRPAAAQAPVAAAEPPLVGVYDPGHAFSGASAADVEHIFVSWADSDAAAQIQLAHAYANSQHRELMVTLEPWPAASRNTHTLLRDIRVGGYDQEIDAVCGAMRALNAPVLVRWGHEMETATGRYPWAADDPAGYVGAYQHFVDRCRGGASQMKFVWSPRGDPALAAFFPGRTYADYVGLSVFDCSTCGIQPASDRHSAASILQDKYHRVLRYDLPVIVAELGIDGTPERQREELLELRQAVPGLPMLKALVYFNSLDVPGAWPLPQRPDWRIAPPLLDLISTDHNNARQSTRHAIFPHASIS